MRILFMGTPDIAAESLAALLDAGHEVCGVFTRRDKPVGRKQILTAPPVKQLAVEHGLSVYQPRTLRDGSSDELIKELAPDIIVVVAYGCIIPPQLLHAAKYGCINLHVSLLPKYRGSAPIQWAVLNGDEGTGVTIMQMDRGLDTGDILLMQEIPIEPRETADSLHDKLAVLGKYKRRAAWRECSEVNVFDSDGDRQRRESSRLYDTGRVRKEKAGAFRRVRNARYCTGICSDYPDRQRNNRRT